MASPSVPRRTSIVALSARAWSGSASFVIAFSFPWLLSMARKKPGRQAAGVNGLHGHPARAPVDDGGRPGKLSQRVTTTKERKFRNRGAVIWDDHPRC